MFYRLSAQETTAALYGCSVSEKKIIYLLVQHSTNKTPISDQKRTLTVKLMQHFKIYIITGNG
jgi:hypothetical protein